MQTGIALITAGVVFEALAFAAGMAVLYYVVRAAVRDGMRDAAPTHRTTARATEPPREHATTRPAELDRGAH